MLKTIATTLNTNEVNNKSGNRKIRNFAILDSNTATARHSAKHLIKSNPRANNTFPLTCAAASPQGKNKFAPKTIKTRYLFADAHSIRASLFPEYSKII